MKRNKKGFTLIELLAVIVILAIIALIAVPVIMNILNKSNRSSFRDTAYGIINAGELYYAEQQLDLNGMSENKTFDLQADVNTEGGIQLKGEIPSGKVSVTTEGKVAISIHNGRYYAKKDYDESEVEVYEIMYYSTLNGAVDDINNGKIGEHADATKETAVAGIYTGAAGNVSVVLLQDTTIDTRAKLSTDVTINLGGNILTSTDKVVVDTINGDEINVVIDGRLEGSSIRVSDKNRLAKAVQIQGKSNVTINGGTYICEVEDYETVCISAYHTSILTINDAIVKTEGIITNASAENRVIRAISIDTGVTAKITNSSINAISNNAKVQGLLNQSGATITIIDSNINASSTNGAAYGVNNNGTATISNSNIKSLSNYTVDNGKHIGYSTGVDNAGILTINNSYVMGLYSGIENRGEIYINGGIYEGYGQGGIYFGGTDKTSYVRNAIIRECDMPEGYNVASVLDNNVGFRVGTEANKINVYMDNNEIYGSVQPIILDGASAENGNNLFISNSNIYTNGKIIINNAAHKLHIGSGNNFTADNTTLPSAVVDDDGKVYTQENIETSNN